LANSAIAESIRGQNIQVGKVDNFIIALDADAPRDRLDVALRAVRVIDPSTLRTPVSDRAIDELKFSECLPGPLARKALSERMTDTAGVRSTLKRALNIQELATS
jgi:ATP-dependent Lhr-like helicase